MVGTSGLEPPTSRLSGVRSNHLSYAPIKNFLEIFNGEVLFRGTSSSISLRETTKLSPIPAALSQSVVLFPFPFGGDEEDRTPDPLRARQVLSQLSYTPVC